MEVTLISTETLKPSYLPVDHHLKPYKLCLFDQITPFTYASIIVFFAGPGTATAVDVTETLAGLKKSLSETLALFYPLSGRPKNDLYVDEFDSGVTFTAARASLSLADFLNLRRNELLNEFVPFPPWRNETDTSKPQMGFQVNLFACGGIAIGTSLGHKIADGGTLSHFLMSWAAKYRGEPEKIPNPNLTEGSLSFPARENLPPNFKTLVSKLWFRKGENYVTRRFGFGGSAVAALRQAATSKRVPKPTRNEALTCFIWKHAVTATETASGTKPRTSIIAHATNMRPRMRSPAMNTAVGNLFWWAKVDSDEAAEAELHELVGALRKSMVKFGVNGEKDDGFKAVSEFLEEMGEILSAEDENEVDILGFSNWNGFFNEVDFGWGKTVWVGAHGKVGDEFRKMVFLVDAQDGSKGIEAFITLEEKQMDALVKDSEFLAFASPDPMISFV